MEARLPGGFIPEPAYHRSLVSSPTPSAASTGSISQARVPRRDRNLLPSPREKPLKSGSARESAFINYVDGALLDISRKYTKRFLSDEEKAKRSSDKRRSNLAEANTSGAGNGGNSAGTTAMPSSLSSPESAEVVGYKDVEAIVQDFEKVLMLVWVSGTATLQIAYLLSIANSVLEYLPAFPPMPAPTFRVLNRLDLAFYMLLRDHKLSGTEKVRLVSIVKLTRSVVLRLMENAEIDDEEFAANNDSSASSDEEDYARGNHAEGEDGDAYCKHDSIKEETEEPDDEMMDIDDPPDSARGEKSEGIQQNKKAPPSSPPPQSHQKEMKLVEEGEEDSWEMEVAKVYERVLTELGDDIASITMQFPSDL